MFARLLISLGLLIITTFCYGADTILIVGDSISAAHGIPKDQGWTHLLSKKMKQSGYNYQVINASISGDTTANGLTRLPALLKKNKPKIVLIELGGNDGLRGLPLTAMYQNLSKMISLSQKDSAQVLLLGIHIPPNYGPAYTSQFDSVFSKLAGDYNIPWVPFILQGVALNKDLMQADGIHPNAKAQPIILNTVWGKLQPLLTK